MAITVEASSLSYITGLASNPPRFPRNPAETKREPLTLYIARVPGKRDVILSTLKPRLKNVTAEDVNSSLYYLHLNVPEDADFAERPVIEDDYEERTSSETIPRKPVTSHLDTGPQPVSFSPESQSPPLTSSQFQRKPLRPPRSTDALGKDLPSPPLPSDESLRRRPLGPRPPQKSGSVIRKPLPRLPGIENAPMQGKPLPTVNFETSTGRNQVPSKTFSITLIRRDPTSNAQWNVGRISSQPLIDDDLVTGSNSDTAHSQIYLHIDTPGYAKFQQIDNDKQTGASTNQGFSRQVGLIYEAHSNRRGRPSMDSQATGESIQDENLVESSKSGRAKGYVFSSPWNGRCSFTTSGGGRSLKCKHTLSGNGNRVNTANSPSYPAIEVSELRFNLPSGAVFSQTTSAPKSSGHGRRFAKFSHIKNKLSEPSKPTTPLSPTTAIRPSTAPTSDDEDDIEDDDGLDQLGHEKAGGGIRGKRVKLGKLIIYHEGMQMLDLLVAANMGIFWRIWDSR